MKYRNLIVGLLFSLIGKQITATEVSGDFIIDLAIKYLVTCSEANFNFDSCLVQSIGQMVLNEVSEDYLSDLVDGFDDRRHRRLSRVLNSKRLDLKKKILEARNIFKDSHQRLLTDTNITDNNVTWSNVNITESLSVAPSSISRSESVSVSESLSAVPSPLPTSQQSRSDSVSVSESLSAVPSLSTSQQVSESLSVSASESLSAAPSLINWKDQDDFIDIINNVTDYNKSNGTDDDFNRTNDEACFGFYDEVPSMVPMLEQSLSFVNMECEARGEGADSLLLQNTLSNVVKVLEAGECLDSTCDDAFPLKLIGWHFETCAGISLPFTSDENEISLEQEKEEKMLQCMVNMAMFMPKSMFGVDEAILTEDEKCYPPNYASMDTFCPTQMGPMLLNICSIMPTNEVTQVNEIYDPTKNEIYLNKFCSFASDVSSPQGRGCLLPLCEWATEMLVQGPDVSDSFSLSSSSSSSSSASAVPTARPTASPTKNPTAVPTKPPTAAPTKVPTRAPTTKSPIAVSKRYAKAEFKAGLTINNIEPEDIPTSGPELKEVVKLLSGVISESLPNDSSSTVIIISIAGIPVHGIQVRRLNAPDGVEVKFKVIMEVLCAENSCVEATADVEELYDEVSDDIETFVEGGELGSKIVEKAESMDLTLFSNVTIDSFIVEDSQFTIVDGNGNEVDDDEFSDDDDSGSVSVNAYYSKAFTLLLTLGFMALGLAF